MNQSAVILVYISLNFKNHSTAHGADRPRKDVPGIHGGHNYATKGRYPALQRMYSGRVIKVGKKDRQGQVG